MGVQHSSLQLSSEAEGEGRNKCRAGQERDSDRQTGILRASDPAWTRVRDQEQDRNREKLKSEVMIARERPASIQAIKMSHGHPQDHPSELGKLVMGGKHYSQLKKDSLLCTNLRLVLNIP